MSVVFESGLLELQGAGILQNGSDLVSREPIRAGRMDFHSDLQLGILDGSQLHQDLLAQPCQVTAVPFRVQPVHAEVPRVRRLRRRGRRIGHTATWLSTSRLFTTLVWSNL